jgi:hypothetical protein
VAASPIGCAADADGRETLSTSRPSSFLKGRVMQELTDAEISRMTPRDVLEYIMHRAMRDGDFELALRAAAEAAPYCNHPMAPMANDVLAGG